MLKVSLGIKQVYGVEFMNKVTNKVIAYAFTVGVVIAIVLGLISTKLSASVVAVLTTFLILAGLIVGFFNISPSEQKDYVLYVTALVVVLSLSGSVLGAVQWIGPYLESVMASIMAFILPSVVVVGLRAVINLAKD